MKPDGFLDLSIRVFRQYGALILLFSGAYFVDLYNFQSVSATRDGINAALEVAKDKEFAIWTTFWDYILMIFGGILWGWQAMRSPGRILKLILVCIVIGLVSSILLGIILHPAAKEWIPDAEFRVILFRIFRGIFPFSISGGIGISTVFVCMLVPRRYRTIGITMLCALAMAGPMLTSIVAGVVGNQIHQVFFLGALMASVWILIFILLRGRMSGYVEQIPRVFFDKSKYTFKSFWRNLHFYVPALLIGAAISFFLSTLISHSGSFYNGIPDQERSFWMYGGICVGCLVSGALSWHFKRRKRVVMIFLALQGLALYLYFYYVQRPPLNDLHHYRYISFLLGGSVGIWGNLLTQVFETMDTRFRLFMCVLAPNVWRGGGGLLLWLSKPSLMDAAVGQAKIDLMLILGFAVLAIAFAAGIYMKDNFEDSSEFSEYEGDGYQEGYPKPINDYKTQSDLLELGKEGQDDIERTNLRGEHIFQRLLKAFQDKIYLSYLYFIPGGGQKINEGKQAKVKTNLKAFDGLSKVNADIAEGYIYRLEDYLKANKCTSLTTLSVASKLEGILLYNSRQASKGSIQGFAYFNLAKVKLRPSDADRLLFEMNDNNPETPILNELVSAGDVFEKTNLAEFAKRLEVKDEKTIFDLKKLLLLRKADAMRYPDGQYWVYVIRPVSISETKVADTALLMQSASEIPLLKLQEISNLLRVVVLEHTNYNYQLVERDAIYRKINLEQNHTLRGEIRSLKERVRSLIAKLKKGNFEEAERLSQFILGKVNWMSTLNIVSLAIMKNEWQTGDKKLEGDMEIKRKPVNVKKKMEEVLDTLMLSMDTIKIETTHEEAILAQCMPALKIDIDNLPDDLTVEVVDEMLYIVLINLLANALAYSDQTNPRVSVRWEPAYSPDRGALHFTNNQAMPAAAAAFIQTGGIGEGEGYSSRHMAGLRTVLTIFKFWQFNEAAQANNPQQWVLDVATDARQTDLFVLIPSSDLVK